MKNLKTLYMLAFLAFMPSCVRGSHSVQALLADSNLPGFYLEEQAKKDCLEELMRKTNKEYLALGSFKASDPVKVLYALAQTGVGLCFCAAAAATYTKRLSYGWYPGAKEAQAAAAAEGDAANDNQGNGNDGANNDVAGTASINMYDPSTWIEWNSDKVRYGMTGLFAYTGIHFLKSAYNLMYRVMHGSAQQEAVQAALASEGAAHRIPCCKVTRDHDMVLGQEVQPDLATCVAPVA